MLKKIVIIGPESTGKSTLCEQLAQHYQTSWCPEFAREYLLKQGKEYNYEDLLTIAKGQLALEDEFIQSTVNSLQPTVGEPGWSSNLKHQISNIKPLFIDTDMYVMKIWCEFVFGKCHRFILDQIVERTYDLYLLCNTDLTWEEDELREYPDIITRSILYRMYRDCMINQSVPWIEVTGNDRQRLKTSIAAVNNILEQ